MTFSCSGCYLPNCGALPCNLILSLVIRIVLSLPNLYMSLRLFPSDRYTYALNTWTSAATEAEVRTMFKNKSADNHSFYLHLPHSREDKNWMGVETNLPHILDLVRLEARCRECALLVQPVLQLFCGENMTSCARCAFHLGLSVCLFPGIDFYELSKYGYRPSLGLALLFMKSQS